MPAADTWMTVCTLDGLYGAHLVPIPFGPALLAQPSLSYRSPPQTSAAKVSDATPTMKMVGSSATLNGDERNSKAIVGNCRTGEVIPTTYEWDRPLAPSTSVYDTGFALDCAPPTPAVVTSRTTSASSCADLSVGWPALSSRDSHSAGEIRTSSRLVTSTANSLASYEPLVPSKPRVHFDSASTHPASVSTTWTALLSASDDVWSDPAITHPASSAFVSAEAAHTSSITHPTFVPGKQGRPVEPESTSLEVPCTYPASQTFTVEPLDPSTCHPASLGTMSLQQPALPYPVQTQHSQAVPTSLVLPSSTNLHPASISTRLPPSYGPSDARYVHPASASFVTFDAATTHPASVWRPGQATDMGDASVSHPGWIGFGVAKPQKSRL